MCVSLLPVLNCVLLPQLARSGVIENTFALCYGFPEGGSMLLGESTVEHADQAHLLEQRLRDLCTVFMFSTACKLLA